MDLSKDRLQNEINELGCWVYYCSRTLLVYLVIKFVHISYRRFIAIRYKFKLSTYIKQPVGIGMGGGVSRGRFRQKPG
jgi:hypothetical protein